MGEVDRAKRVGVVTLPGNFNYGNRLQAYATCAIYSKLGLNPVLVELYDRPNVVRDTKKLIKRLLGRAEEPAPEAKMSEERLEAFYRFSNNMCVEKVNSLQALKQSDYLAFSVGSDQVWNPDYIKYNEDLYFLSFARPEQRIALAPSIGLDHLTHQQARHLAKGLAGFSRLSVREECGAGLIKQCSDRDATVICDPTLVLSSEDWRSVADDRVTPDGQYIFTYLLGGEGAEAAEVLGRVTDSGRIPVISLSDRQKPGESDAGPSEFISLIDNACHVVTDSFHASVFSSILQTPLTIVHREGGASMFGRLETLTQTLGIQEKVYGSSKYSICESGYEGVSDAIANERNKFMRYLKDCLVAQLGLSFKADDE